MVSQLEFLYTAMTCACKLH